MSKLRLTRLQWDLAIPFPPHKVKWRQSFGQGNKQLAYINARDVMVRLDEVVGIDGWQTKYPFAGCCELSLKINGVWITKSNLADETNIQAMKGQASDAFKRAAASFGVARYLYGIKTNVIPYWATPEGFHEVAEIIGEENVEENPDSNS